VLKFTPAGVFASLPLCNPGVKQAYAVEVRALGICRPITSSRQTLPPKGEIAGMLVFVVDAEKKPLSPCHSAVARKLLATGKAAVLRRYPFTIILRRDTELPVVRPLRLKIDPGSKVTGITIVDDATGTVVFAAEVAHRGQKIRAAVSDRRALRRARRNRKTRYRKPRFDDRRRRKGWLPPSIKSRVANIETWVSRLCRFAPIGAISLELVRFDTQAMQNPEISGVEYQQGELAGYEVREYLLEKWQRRCAYCGAESVPLQIEHIVAKDRGGSNRVSNLTLACQKCNRTKNNRPVEEFLANKPEVLERILEQAKTPLKDAAVVNAARWELFRRLKETALPLETGTGGRTKFNRTRLGLPKTHWLDAACVGASTPETLKVEGVRPLLVRATGRGRRRRCNPDRFGFARGHAGKQSAFFGLRTGDVVRAEVPKGKQAGTHVGRAAVRSTGSFRVGKSDGISWRYCRLLHRRDGYDYGESGATFPPLPLKGRGFHAVSSL
jgi:5-methylcytosine-specific restriction endonuclease McrA